MTPPDPDRLAAIRAGHEAATDRAYLLALVDALAAERDRLRAALGLRAALDSVPWTESAPPDEEGSK